MRSQGIEFEQMPDVIAFRIITNELAQCYEALGLIHQLWKPVPGRFKDYIAIPKPNMYQSLHTTVIGPLSERIEVQIRTEEMHRSPRRASPPTGPTRRARARSPRTTRSSPGCAS